ncbi:MAG TPA: carboxymuconolactone decarboxylase family protein, partial [Polyangiaceae bacterium]
MQPRIKHPVALFPEALQAGLALAAPLKKCDVPPHTLLFMQLRASQINGCGFCVDMHARELRQGGEREERIAAVGAWRDTP